MSLKIFYYKKLKNFLIFFYLPQVTPFSKKLLCCNRNYQKQLKMRFKNLKENKNFEKRRANTSKCLKRDVNKFILLLPKIIYLYEYPFTCKMNLKNVR